MKKSLLHLSGLALAMTVSANLFAQTATPGTLTFTYTEVAKTPTYNGTPQHSLAIWIQDGTGKFVKTKQVSCCMGSTLDHLPSYAIAASCGVYPGTTIKVPNDKACNKVDATSSATITTWQSNKVVTWDGKNTNGTANGTTVADGTYKVTIESCWNHGGTGTGIIVKSYTFTKGPNADHQTPADDAYFKGMKLDWVPAGVGIDEATETQNINVYPNPTTGIFNVDFNKASKITVVNALGLVVYDQKVEETAAGTKSIDLSNFANGVYFIHVFNGDQSSPFKVILNQ